MKKRSQNVIVARVRAFSLVEVAMAVGIASFCLIGLIGIFPVMLNSIRESREKTLVSRMYQTVTDNLREVTPDVKDTRTFDFDAEGFLLEASPGAFQVARQGVKRYQASAVTLAGTLPGSSASTNLILAKITIVNTVRNSTNLERPIWVARHED